MPAFLREMLLPEVDATIQRLDSTDFKPDPIAGRTFSKIVSVMSSAYKRHGHILQLAIFQQLRRNPRFEVWDEPLFQVTQTADHVVDGNLGNAEGLSGTQLNYAAIGHRTLQIDVIVYDRETQNLTAYEVKRGFGHHDAGKKRSILRDTLCTQVLLKSYGESRGLAVNHASCKVIFYYGVLSVRPPFGMSGADMDAHFGWPVHEAVEGVNLCFRDRLFQILGQ